MFSKEWRSGEYGGHSRVAIYASSNILNLSFI